MYYFRHDIHVFPHTDGRVHPNVIARPDRSGVIPYMYLKQLSVGYEVLSNCPRDSNEVPKCTLNDILRGEEDGGEGGVQSKQRQM